MAAVRSLLRGKQTCSTNRSIFLEPPTTKEGTGSVPRESKIIAPSKCLLDSSCSRCRKLSCESGGIERTKTDSKSVAYEFRTKSAQSGGSETDGPRERISGSGGFLAVRRSLDNARGYWASFRARKPQRMLDAEGLAEREELGSNGL